MKPPLSPPPVPGMAAGHRETVDMLRRWAEVLTHVDLEGLLRDIARAEAIGPAIDPDLYRRSGKAMREARQLLEAARRLQSVGILQRGRGTPEPLH